MTRNLIAVAPDTGRHESLQQAVRDAGAELVAPTKAVGLIWADFHRPDDLAPLLSQTPAVEWVALPFAGVEPYIPLVRERTDLIWTCARGVYARPVAEHAIAMAAAGLRHIVGYAGQTSWGAPHGRMLVDGAVTIFGGGGITTEIIRMLQGWEIDITVVRRSVTPVPGASRTLQPAEAADAVRGSDAVMLAQALTEETRGSINAEIFDAMEDHAWLVNVARGGVVDHDALHQALLEGLIGGAALDVTDPEPLPEGHPLWTLPNVLITPHIANTPEMGIPLLAAHIRSNVRRWLADEGLDGRIDPVAGY